MAGTLSAKIKRITLLGVVLGLGLAAQAVAQSDQAILVLTDVDSQAFPQVVASVAASDAGGPRDGLTEANFSVFEDTVPVPADSVVVTPDDSQEVCLVLALDVSMPGASLDALKAASLSFIDTLRQTDQAAVVAFYDQIVPVQGFTGDKQLLRAAIEGLAPEGNLTAFNDAAFDAVTALNAFPTSRRAVVLLTNSRDNISAHSSEQVISQARAGGTAVYAVGFDKIEPATLQTLAAETGGQAFVLSDPAQAEASMVTIAESLRRGGYRVTFQSGLKADNAKHDLLIRLAYEGKAGEASGQFTAVPGPVTVSLPSFSQGQTVSGTLELAMQASAPATIASVTYRLDDTVLGQAVQAPFSLDWDSATLEPGTYRLTVEVVDQAGNQGQASVDLNVVRPLTVSVSAPQANVPVGAQLPVAVKIEALAEVARVDFLLDGSLVSSRDAPPYALSLDTSAYPPGAHHITVRVVDSLGHEASSDLDLQFLAPPPPEPEPRRPSLADWFNANIGRQGLIGAGTLICALALLALSIIALLAILRMQKKGVQAMYHLEIANMGNIASRYALRAEDPMGALRFLFTLHGVNLPGLRPVETEPAVAEATATPVGTPAAGPSPGELRRTGSAVTGTLSEASYLLPGSLGASLQRAVRPVYQAQSKIGTTTARVESQAARASRLAPGAPPISSTASPAGAPTRPGTAPVGQPAAPLDRDWVETPLIGPQETLPIDMRIGPVNPYRDQSYGFKAFSRASEAPDAPLVTETGQVHITGISGFMRVLPYLIFALVMLAIVIAAMLFLQYMDVT